MDRRITPPKWVTSPTWGPPPPCKQALNPPPPSRQYQNFIFLQMTGNHVLGREAVSGQGSDVDLD